MWIASVWGKHGSVGWTCVCYEASTFILFVQVLMDGSMLLGVESGVLVTYCDPLCTGGFRGRLFKCIWEATES